MSLAPYTRILARGPGRSRSYTQEEAAEVMRLMLAEGQTRRPWAPSSCCCG